ncbi:helix-turn-helix domain-containing protein [Kitasatospora saccharophila]|uniref:Helix-turn-helix domain-containing protein n=1 Tax=Kitasatospora saccharophila TaxID=407973 RepID=A0ABP5JVC4_9ACTN
MRGDLRSGPTELPPEASAGAPAAPTGILKHAAGLLRGEAPAIADRALARIRAEVGHYASSMLSPQDAAACARTAMEIAVESLAVTERFLESGEQAWRTGRKRAAEGTPMLALLQAYRIGASVLWDCLVEAALRDAPEQAQAMLYAANDFWRFAARDTTIMMEAHRQTVAGLAPDDGRKLLPALKALLRGHTDPMDVAALAVAFDIPVTGRYAVARLDGPGALRPAEAPVREEAAGIRLYWCPLQDGQAVVALLGDRPVKDLVGVLPSGPGVRVGISSAVTGLAEIGRARELAELALGVCRPDGEPVQLDDRMAAAFVLARPDLAAGIAGNVLGPVLGLDPADRASLLDTLEVWIDCQGSSDRAGELLYCHRNTVLNRLRRLERLTGRFLDRPRDLVDLTLALEACRTGAAGADLCH